MTCYSTNSLVNVHLADDITGLAKGLSINELVKTVNHEIQKLGVWLRSNKLTILITSKTKIIVFHPKGKSVPTEIVFEINNNDLDTVQDPSLIYPIEILTNKSQIFGFWLDENLSLDYHVSVTSKKNL